MHVFTDTESRSWQVVIHVAAVKRLRAVLDLDLYALLDEGCKPLSQLLDDPCRLCDVLYTLCIDQADKRGVSDQDFGRGLGGDSLAAAADAFCEALIDFFPQSRGRAAVRKVIAKGREIRDRLLDRLEPQVTAIDPDSAAQKLIDSYGSPPASAASTPDP